jgi:signal transduction histidine kinase/CheY-like chemotaxis protein
MRQLSPVHPMGCVRIYAIIYFVVCVALIRPYSSPELPVDRDGRLMIMTSLISGSIVAGASIAIASVHILRLGINKFLNTTPHTIWAMLSVSIIVALSHALVASQQTLAITDSQAIISRSIPLSSIERLCAHAIGWNILAYKCGASQRARWLLQFAIWMMNFSAFVLSFAFNHTAVLDVTVIAIALSLPCLSGLLQMVRKTAAERVHELPKASVVISNFMIPLGVPVIWLIYVPQLLSYFGLISIGYSSCLSSVCDGLFALMMTVTVSDVLWNAEKAITQQIQEETARRTLAEVQYDTQNKFLRYLFHELRVPLNGIMLASEEMAEQPRLSGTEQENITIIGMGAMAMSKLLDDCLCLAKIEAGKLLLEYAPFSPRDLIASITGLFHFRYKTLQYTTVISDNLPNIMVGDEGKLRQVLSNFTSNAIKFTPPGGSITIYATMCSSPDFSENVTPLLRSPTSHHKLRASLQKSPNPAFLAPLSAPAAIRKASDTPPSTIKKVSRHHSSEPAFTFPEESVPYILYVVEDTGIGISKEDQAKLFQPFEQIRAGATQKGNGTGLGLSICKIIIEHMHGVIGCESEEGHGSRFWCAVPLIPISKPEVALPAPSSAAAPLDSRDSAGAGAASQAVLPSPQISRPLSSMKLRQMEESPALDSLSVEIPPLKQEIVQQMKLETALGKTPSTRNSAATFKGDRGTPARSASLNTRLSPVVRKMHHVVVVDDTDSNRLLLGRLLKRLGASKVSLACNGVEALQDESWLSADAWFVDRNMPMMDGMQLCEQLRKQKNYTGFIFGLTGDALQSDRDAFVKAGATAVLSKPTTTQAVSSMLRSFGIHVTPRPRTSTDPSTSSVG